MVKVYAVRLENGKYNELHEHNLREKIPNIEFIRDEVHPFIRQWNKLRFMELDCDEPICVIDVDIELTGNYMELFNHPIERGEFLGIPAWWRDTWDERYTINGGFYKYYPKDCKYIAEKFRKDPRQWSTHYVRNGTTVGPINGEQYFVEDSVNERLNLKLVPEEWVARGPNYIPEQELKLIHNSWQKSQN